MDGPPLAHARGYFLSKAKQASALSDPKRINKLLTADWQTGQFLHHWTHDVLQLQWFMRLEETAGSGFSSALSWLTIVIELSLAVLVCRPRCTRAFIALGLAFHIGMLVFTAGTISWIFLRVMFLAYLGFVNVPGGPPVAAPATASVWRLLLAWPEPGGYSRTWLVWGSLAVWWVLR